MGVASGADNIITFWLILLIKLNVRIQNTSFNEPNSQEVREQDSIAQVFN